MEGYSKITKMESAVNLQIIPSGDNDSSQEPNVLLDEKSDANSVEKVDGEENKVSDPPLHPLPAEMDQNGNEDEKVLDEDVGDNDDGVEKKDNVLLDGMLSDLLEMKSLDPNKIHEMN
eukprot:UN07527